jgi:hypothetical protein
VLLFVIRDKSKTPLSKLVEVLSEDVHKMWDTISKPPQYVDSKIDDFFEVGAKLDSTHVCTAAVVAAIQPGNSCTESQPQKANDNWLAQLHVVVAGVGGSTASSAVPSWSR